MFSELLAIFQQSIMIGLIGGNLNSNALVMSASAFAYFERQNKPEPMRRPFSRKWSRKGWAISAWGKAAPDKLGTYEPPWSVRTILSRPAEKKRAEIR